MEKPKTEIEALEKTIEKWEVPARTGEKIYSDRRSCALCLFHGWVEMVTAPNCKNCCLKDCSSNESLFGKYIDAKTPADRSRYAQQIVDTCKKRLAELKAEEAKKAELWICEKAKECTSSMGCVARPAHTRSDHCVLHSSGSWCPFNGSRCIPYKPEPEKDEEKLYNVRVDLGLRTLKDAETEAVSLARKYYGKPVYLFKAIKSCKATEPNVKWEDIP
jgi:hypothetical protein